jgi:Lsr2
MPSTAAPPRASSASGWTAPGSEIDLNAGHARELRDALARYVDAARRVGSSARRPPRGGRRGPAGDLNAVEVREWARAQGIEVKDRGRVPADLIVKFRAATS